MFKVPGIFQCCFTCFITCPGDIPVILLWFLIYCIKNVFGINIFSAVVFLPLSGSTLYLFSISLSLLEQINVTGFVPHSNICFLKRSENSTVTLCHTFPLISVVLQYRSQVSRSLCSPSTLVGIVKHQVTNIARMLPHQFDKALKQ